MDNYKENYNRKHFRGGSVEYPIELLSSEETFKNLSLRDRNPFSYPFFGSYFGSLPERRPVGPDIDSIAYRKNSRREFQRPISESGHGLQFVRDDYRDSLRNQGTPSSRFGYRSSFAELPIEVNSNSVRNDEIRARPRGEGPSHQTFSTPAHLSFRRTGSCYLAPVDNTQGSGAALSGSGTVKAEPGLMAVLPDSDRELEESVELSNGSSELEDLSRPDSPLMQNSPPHPYLNFLESSKRPKPLQVEGYDGVSGTACSSGASSPLPPNLAATAIFQQAIMSSLAAGYPSGPHPFAQSGNPIDADILVRALASRAPRKPRGEKKPIPNDLKDSRYYERRRRNNAAAKKSRDARKKKEEDRFNHMIERIKENNEIEAAILTRKTEFRVAYIDLVLKGLPLSVLIPKPEPVDPPRLTAFYKDVEERLDSKN